MGKRPLKERRRSAYALIGTAPISFVMANDGMKVRPTARA